MGKIKYPTTTNCAKDQCPPNSPDHTQPTRQPCVVCDASSISQTSVKANTIPELKSALQQICDDLPQTTTNKAINDFRKRLNACVSADVDILSIYDVNWVVALNMA